MLERVAVHTNRTDLEAWLRTYDVACKESVDFKGLVALFKRLEVPISHLETR